MTSRQTFKINWYSQIIKKILVNTSNTIISLRISQFHKIVNLLEHNHIGMILLGMKANMDNQKYVYSMKAIWKKIEKKFKKLNN